MPKFPKAVLRYFTSDLAKPPLPPLKAYLKTVTKSEFSLLLPLIFIYMGHNKIMLTNFIEMVLIETKLT